jgi:protein gp37
MTKTKIEWADRVWNPTTGCSAISAGCLHCYAERIAQRFWGERPFTEVRIHPERLIWPTKWRKPVRVFVDSMSDLFHPLVPDEFIWRVFESITMGNRRHTYMILTKRPGQMRKWFEKYQTRFYNYHAPGEPEPEHAFAPWPDPCIWLGVSAENQKTAEERIPLLLDTPAAVRFVSAEPLQGPIILPPGQIDWLIVGGESGPGAYPTQPDWVRSLRDQAQERSIPFFFKQWGGARPGGAAELDGREWKEFPAPRPKTERSGW